MDKVIQGNTADIVFLKSTDDSMIDTLSKMSGTTHRSFTDSKTITRDMSKLWMKNEGKASYTMTTREVPTIMYNDMAFISPRNSIVFRAGDSPIWNRNETILPMSWKLFSNTITQSDKKYTLQTIPTLSSAVDFDVRKNQPDFNKMLDKRMKQALAAEDAKTAYAMTYGYTDYQISQLDPDNYADEIMEAINTFISEEADDDNFDPDDFDDYDYMSEAENNEEVEDAVADAQQKYNASTHKKFAGGMLAPEDLVSLTNGSRVTHAYDREILDVYSEIKGDMWNDTDYFVNRNGNLYGIDGTPYIIRNDESKSLNYLNNASKEYDSSVFADEGIDVSELNNLNTYRVEDGFYRFLASLDAWTFAKGRFEDGMRRRLRDA